MAETTTPNYGWTMPDPGASANTWGATLNATTQKVDAQVFVNQQGLVPVGAITMFGGPQSNMPSNWMLCAGQSLNTTTYATLFAVVGYMFGGSGANFSLPNLVGRFPMGMTNGEVLGQTGGEATHVLTAAELAAHAHPITDVAHSHTAQQNAHSHGITTGNHAHGITTGSHAHTVQQWGTGGGIAVRGDAPSYFQQNTTVATSTVGNLGGNTDTQQPAVGVNASGTGLSTTQNAGSGAAHNNMPPYLQLNFIIKYQ